MEIDIEGSFYDARVDEFGEDIRAVGWRSREQQELRFRILSEGIRNSGITVLDLGCGFGDLFRFLTRLDIEVSEYVGIDTSRKMVLTSQAALKQPNVRFEQADLSFKSERHFDYIFLSGTLNLASRRAPAEKLRDLAKFCVSNIAPDGELRANFLSTKVDFSNPLNHHFSPIETLSFFQTVFEEVTLVEDYGLYEFTIYCKGVRT